MELKKFQLKNNSPAKKKSILSILTSIITSLTYLYATIAFPYIQAEEFKKSTDETQKISLDSNNNSNVQNETPKQRNKSIKNSKESSQQTNKKSELNAQSQIFSNAYNFASLFKQSVDSRSGNYQFSAAIGQVFGKNLSIPFTLTLNYLQNPGAKDYFGFGTQWKLNLTHYDIQNKTLYLDGGQSFQVLFSDNIPYLKYDKGLNIRIVYDNASQGFNIINKDGRTEYLNSQGKLKSIRDSIGNKLIFNYNTNDGSLQSITDDSGTIKMTFSWGGSINYIYSLSQDGRTWLETKINSSNVSNSKVVNTVFLPQTKGTTTDNNPSVRFQFSGSNPFILDRINLPSQATYSLQYIDLLSANNTKIKAVKTYTIDPGKGQEKIVTNYSYDGGDGHNYLAHNSGVTTQAGDPLYDTNKSYKYMTAIDNGLTKVWTTYNKFHLVEKQDTYDISIPNNFRLYLYSYLKFLYKWFFSLFDIEKNNELNSNIPVSTISYTYPVDLSKSFTQLPNNYALPISKVTTINGTRTVTTSAQYNNNGNMISSTDAKKMKQEIVYCAVSENNTQCKPEASGFEKNVRYIKITDSNNQYFFTTNYFYKNFSSKDSGPTFTLAIKSIQSDFNGLPYLTSITNYNESISSVFYAFPTSSTAYNSSQTLTNNYSYNLDNNNFIVTKSYSTVDKLTEISAINKFVNLPAYGINHQGIKTAYTYDNWGRILTETTFPSTTAQQKTTYEYHMNEKDPDQGGFVSNYVITTSPSGYKTKSVLDGLGREYKFYKYKTDSDGSLNSSGNQNYVLLSETSYNQYGFKKIITVYNLEYSSAGNSKLVNGTTEIKYDFLGRIIEKKLPDDIKQISTYNDTNNIVETYILAKDGDSKSPISQLTFNNSDQKIRESILNPTTRAEIYFKSYSYEGFGRIRNTTDSNNASITYSYNVNGTVNWITYPNNESIGYNYDIFGNATTIKISSTNNILKTLGRRTFDNLGRLTSETNAYGYITSYIYNGTGDLSEVKVPQGNNLQAYDSYYYNYDNITHNLKTSRVNNKTTETVNYSYNPKTLALTQTVDKTGTFSYSYYTDNSLKTINHNAAGGISGFQTSNYTLSYNRYDYLGHIVNMTDINNNSTIYDYNSSGLLAQILYTNPSGTYETAKYTYDTFNRLQNESFQNSKVSRDYTYDNLSQLASLTNKLNSQTVTGFTFSYFNNANLKSRARTNNKGQIANEQYNYDTLNNLKNYTCSGDLCPKDQNGKQVLTENYTFDTFNNISSVTSSYSGQSSNTTNYNYDSVDPYRLLSYTNTLSNIYPNSRAIVYDNNGRITSDDLGNIYTYNEFGQTVSFKSAKNSSVVSYVYDYTDRQVLEKLPGQSPVEMIYGANTLVNEKQGNSIVNYLFGLNGKEARFVTDSSTKNQIPTYFAFDQAGSIVNEMSYTTTGTHTLSNLSITFEKAFTPYGVESTLSLNPNRIPNTNYISNNEFGFDGQRTDYQTGLQFLGDGYRAYNPVLHHFMSYDSLSPFNNINGYSFANNNPIMFYDPSGHMSTGGTIGMVLGFVAGIALTALTGGAAAPVVAALGIAEGTAAAAVTGAAINIAVAAVAGAAIGAVTQTISDVIDKVIPGKDVALAAAFGAAGGAIGSFAGEAVGGAASWAKGASGNLKIATNDAVKFGSKELQEVAECPGGVCTPNSGACFTGETLVAISPANEENMQSQNSKPIRDIQIGDMVQTSSIIEEDSSLEKISLKYEENENGNTVSKFIEIIRSKAWLEKHGLFNEGDELILTLPEYGMNNKRFKVIKILLM